LISRESAVRKLLAVALLMLASSAVAGEDAGTLGKQAATQAESYLKGKISTFGSAISGSGNFTTMNGTSFSASLEKPQSVSKIKLVVNGGDLYAEIDGKLSYAHVSGICENGYVSCDPGTWNNCKYYVYKNGSFQPASSYQELLSCFCVSQGACGFKWSDYWLKWALNKFTQMIGYTDATFVDVVTDTSATRDFTAVSTSGTVSESAMADTDTALQEIEGNKVVNAYKNNPYMNQGSVYECEIKNVPILDVKEKSFYGEGRKGIGTDHYVYIRILDDGSGIIRFQWTGTSPYNVVGWNGCNPARWIDMDTFDWSSYKAFGKITFYYYYVTAGCAGSGSVYTAVDGSGSFFEGASRLNRACSDGGCQYPTASYSWTIRMSVDIPKLEVSNGCRPQEGCRLKDEEVCDLEGNCFYTYRNFVPISFGQKVQSYTIHSPQTGHTWTFYANGKEITVVNENGTEVVLRNDSDSWFIIKRIYQCDSSGINVDSAISRGVEIEKNSFFENNKVGYSGSMGCSEVNGKWVCYATNTVYSSESECKANCSLRTSVDIGNSPYSVCTVGNSTGVYVCKVALYGNEVRAEANGTDLSPNSVDLGSVNYEYRPCEAKVDSDGKVSYVCPVKEGEKIVKDCTCDTSDEALRAVATIEALDQMSHDIICSSSPP
jgi:hypothetical protein